MDEATTSGQGGSSPGPSDAPDVIQRKTLKVLGERLSLLGATRSGAYDHYSQQFDAGFPIRPGELAILNLIRRQLPDLRSYHEIGSGLGTLPLMLAHDGFAAVGIERDERRHLTATAILRELGGELPQIEANCRLIGASFPDAVDDLDVSGSMAILTDFVSTQAPQDYVRLCRRLAQYRYVLLDVQRFCDKRDAVDDQDRLIEELVSYGLSPTGEAIAIQGWGDYRLFEGAKYGGRTERAAHAAPSTADAVASPPSEADTPVATQEREPVVAVATELEARPMTELKVRQVGELAPMAAVLPPTPRRARHRRFGGWLGLSALLVIGIPTLLAIAYYGYFASGQYITSMQFAVRGPSQANAGRNPAAAMSGASMMSPDAFVVTDYINSRQALADTERKIDVRAMFARPDADFLARLPSHVTSEQMTAYWARMVRAQFDLISGNVTVSVRAFTPEESLKLARTLVDASDDMFRRLNGQAQRDYVRVADENLGRAQKQLAEARQALLAFREASGFVDPDKTALAGSAIVDEMRKQLAQLQSQHAAIQAVSPNSPTLTSLRSQMTALEGQIRSLDQLGSTAVRAVSPETLARYQSLDLERQFAEKQYTEALGLKSQAYMFAQNQQSYLALFVEPTLAQTSLYPARLFSIATVVLAAAGIWFVGTLITYSVRDHLM